MKRVLAAVVTVCAGVACLSSPAWGDTSSILIFGKPGQQFTAVATGAVTAVGTMSVQSFQFGPGGSFVEVERLTFDDGTLSLTLTGTFDPSGVNPQTCTGSISSTATAVVSGGTGLYANASGSGSFAGRAIVAGPSAMGCAGVFQLGRFRGDLTVS